MLIDLYQGNGVSTYTTKNVKGLLRPLSWTCWTSSQRRSWTCPTTSSPTISSCLKLIEVLGEKNIKFTGTIRQDCVKGSMSLTPMKKFKKMCRGYHETVVLYDQSQIVI